ncbi:MULTISPECIES: aldo/keto reductase [Caldilinea]|jgi:aryl-alcohol dehydrogenase-like predicted oxidoreductase|uniref:Putative oxidoreductase n=1 Tax=Caldilinea aerophila (strain DSM 14535 / JCM 11387 / NBRC 104270 / STL-6-O1) TaxID=926550 RepID=I0I907_CALAS|nr:MULTISPECIES: aldo/keto reductase [Caldilinea]MBO9392429.1 aldo/keto reductase [Caldilinea sp.]BAM01745.1 putative oxidoreductase [Caldilinea aerophila DSM 14535 = NBRC 104270]GIV73081.1 MAG: oxidoreductase [Caldilinea sp.]
MNYRNLGRTGLKVSELCLGTMQWGWTADEKTSWQVMDAFVEAGGNFIDTADIYSNWAPNNPGGVSEEIIGRWMKARNNRHQMVVATKVRGRMWEGPNGEGLSRVHILKACEDSLRRLQTDYIDLYQAHWYDAETPIEETMDAFDTLVRQGKVRYVGCSNYPAWRLMEALWASDKHHLVRYDSLQPHYNLAHRAEYERELKEVCLRFGLGVIPYSPLAGGFLTGKYTRDSAADSARAESIKRRYFNEAGWRVLDAVKAVAAELGSTPTAISLAWLLAQPEMTAPIIGANSVQQLQASLAACDLNLTEEQMATLNQASAWQAGV